MKQEKTSLSGYVYVLSPTGKPLMPTRRYARVRRLLDQGKAKIVGHSPLIIQLLYETPEQTQMLIMGIDPGVKTIGVAVRRANGEVVYAGELELRTREVTEKVEERRRNRRARRGYRRLRRLRRHKKEKETRQEFRGFESRKYRIAGIEEELECKGIKPGLLKFANRKRKEGWLTPTAEHLLASHENFVARSEKMLPIAKVKLEYARFDIHKLAKPEVRGKEYQQGRKRGYANTREYVLCRDRHTCRLCGGQNREMQTHHVIWRQENGADTPENLVTLCVRCHRRVHANEKVDAQVRDIFTKMKKRFVPATLLNMVMERFYQWLVGRFGEVDKVYGYEVKELRQTLLLEKEHSLDAYLASLLGDEEISTRWRAITVYRYKQFRRHNRQLIHARRDRNYYDPRVKKGKQIVAKNRHRRRGQNSDSLVDYLGKTGKHQVGTLRVSTGKKMIRRKCKEHKTTGKQRRTKTSEELRHTCKQCSVFRPGDIVRRKAGGRASVVTGSGHKGYSVVFYGEKGYQLAKNYSLVLRNTGIVCVGSAVAGKK